MIYCPVWDAMVIFISLTTIFAEVLVLVKALHSQGLFESWRFIEV